MPRRVEAEWLTWEAAAAFVGCPVPTIDWNKRLGRIRSRRERPSLERASVEEFAVWWRERRAARSLPRRRQSGGARPRRGPARPDREHWADGREAAQALGVSLEHVGWLARQGHLVATVEGGRRWVRRDTLAALVDERAGWVTWVEAQQIVGCSSGPIRDAVAAGLIRRREQSWRALPGLRRDDVEAFAEHWAGRRRRREQERQARAPGGAAPDDGHVWLSTTTTALVLGLSPAGVRYRAERDLVPHVRSGARLWFRRDHVEQAAAARAWRGKA